LRSLQSRRFRRSCRSHRSRRSSWSRSAASATATFGAFWFVVVFVTKIKITVYVGISSLHCERNVNKGFLWEYVFLWISRVCSCVFSV
jgi:hypothetical protein